MKARKSRTGNSAEFDKFRKAVKQIISVPKTELARREAEYQKQREKERNGKR